MEYVIGFLLGVGVTLTGVILLVRAFRNFTRFW